MSKDTVMVVDDEYVTVARLMDDLTAAGFDVEFVSEIAAGREKIDENPTAFAAILIDVMFPRGDKKLQEYERLLAQHSAQSYLEARGQALGLYLQQKYPELPYAYISLRPSAFVITEREFPSANSRPPGKPWLLNKFDLIKVGDIGEQVTELIKQWPKPQHEGGDKNEPEVLA